MAAMQGQRRDDGHDHSRLRVSDQDRHQVAEVLREAAGEGRIDLDELDERLGATYAAKTYGELVPLTADLPVAGLPVAGLPVAGRGAEPVRRPAGRPAAALSSYSSSTAVMSDCTRRGPWLVPEQHAVFSLMGSVNLDLREATFATREVTITANAVMAGIDIIVNPGTRVVVHGTGVMGEFKEGRSKVGAELTADSPVVHVRGFALMAGVNVRRKAMPGEDRKRLAR
jgi:hypothetical protein